MEDWRTHMKFKNFVAESNDGVDVVKVTVPLLIRLLEWAREEAKNDIQIHELTEKIVKKNGVLNSDDYDSLMS